MTVANLLKSKGTKVVTIDRHTKVSEAVRKLKTEGIGALVVSSDGNRVEGIVSERDIVCGLADRGAALLDREVSDVMTGAVMTCAPGDSVKQAMSLMTHHRTRHVPVIDDHKLVGIISIGDVVKDRLEEVEMEANVLRDSYIARQ
jgi:CBS domain-containing protein